MSFSRTAALAACLLLFPLCAIAATQPIPLPWKAGLKLAYDSTSVDERENKGVSRKTTTTMTTTIEIVEASNTGFVQSWRDGPADVRVEGNGPDNASERESLVELQKRFEGASAEITLDATASSPACATGKCSEACCARH